MTESRIITIENLDEYKKIITSAKSVFLDFGASWCGPCKRLSSDLHEWIDKENKFKNVTIAKIDVDNDKVKDLTEDITSVPTVYLYKNGKRVEYTHKSKKYNVLEGYDKNVVLGALEWLNS